MAAIGAIVVTGVGSVAAPSSLGLTLGTAITIAHSMRSVGPVSTCPLPALRGVMFANGVQPLFHVISTTAFFTGMRAPEAALTVAPSASGARATAVLTTTANFQDGSVVKLGKPEQPRLVKTVTTLVTTGAEKVYDQVLIGASASATLDNFVKLLNDTGIQGTGYFNVRQAQGFKDYTFTDYGDMTSSAKDATTITFRAETWGTNGNGYNATEVTDVGGTFSFTTAISGGAAGSGIAPDSGAFSYGYAYYRQGDLATSGLSPSAEIVKFNNDTVDLTAFVDPAARDKNDPGENFQFFFRSFRTTNRGSVYYRVRDDDVAAAEPYNDTRSDDALTEAFPFVYDPALYRTFAGGYPTIGRYVALFKGSVWTGGALLQADYKQGRVLVTDPITTPNTVVTLTAAANLKEDVIGRVLAEVGAAESEQYRIVNASGSGNTITLGLEYQQANKTGAGAVYAIKDTRDPFELFWSVSGLPNNFPEANSLKGVTSTDPTGITGLLSAWDSLVVFTRTGVWRVSGDEGSFRLLPQGDGCGCFTGNSVQNVEGTLYWLGPGGVFAWGGGGDPQSVSRPPLDEAGARGIQGTLARINLEAADGIVSDYNPTQNVIRWFVPLDTDEDNNSCVTYDLQSGAFSLDTCEAVTSAASLSDAGGDFVTVVGDRYGNLFQLDISTSDGAYGFEAVQSTTAYSASARTVTVAGTPFPTADNGLAGVPVWHVSAAGAVQRAKIASNTSSVLTLTAPFATAPADGTQIVVGAIPFDIQTGRWDYGAPDLHHSVTKVTVGFVKQSAAVQLWCAAAIDSSDPTVLTLRAGGVDVADLSTSDGEYTFWHRTGKGRRVVLRFFALGPGGDVSLTSFVPLTQDQAERVEE